MNSQNTKLIIPVLIVLVLIVLWKLIPKETKQMPVIENKMEEVTQESMEEKSIFEGTVLDLLKKGKDLKCEYFTEQYDIKMTGVSYISGKNMRTDIESQMGDGNIINSSMISDGEWVYTWSSQLNKGMKIRMLDEEDNRETEEAMMEEETDSSASLKDLQNSYKFNCEDWKADSSKFIVPTDVEFVDLQPVQSTTEVLDACAACGYIQDSDLQATCLAACKQ